MHRSYFITGEKSQNVVVVVQWTVVVGLASWGFVFSSPLYCVCASIVTSFSERVCWVFWTWSVRREEHPNPTSKKSRCSINITVDCLIRVPPIIDFSASSILQERSRTMRRISWTRIVIQFRMISFASFTSRAVTLVLRLIYLVVNSKHFIVKVKKREHVEKT